ncbi:MAG: DUF1566 domain-containing protein [Candidatus Kapabacteria bacterium]|nr:DUF1566 domain-containing protein [Candidatus Kapabacteria bacterium]
MKQRSRVLSSVFGAVFFLSLLSLGSCSSNVEPVRAVGDLHAGGVVIDVWVENGKQHGIVLAITDQSFGSTWSNVVEREVGSVARSKTDGLPNSLAIIAQQGHAASAAQTCLDYAADGYNDWYLPAIEELEKVYENLDVINKTLSEVPGATPVTKAAGYWSSTENGAILAWNYNFNFGIASNYSTKSLRNFRVRAVREF